MNEMEGREKLFDSMVNNRISDICDKVCLGNYYLKLQNDIIETRKLITANLQNDSNELLNVYDKLNNDISELIHKTLYFEGFKDGKFINRLTPKLTP